MIGYSSAINFCKPFLRRPYHMYHGRQSNVLLIIKREYDIAALTFESPFALAVFMANLKNKTGVDIC
jgi:hypothetical protein